MPEAPRIAELLSTMQRLSLTVGVAESLTGGLVLAALTDIPGASASVRGGFVVYATDLKATLAGVEPELLAARGAVDPDVAIALARGAHGRLGASIGVGVTGVAGPDPQDGKPVGTVFVAVSCPWLEHVERYQLDGTRQEIRQAAVNASIDALEATVAAYGPGAARESERRASR